MSTTIKQDLFNLPNMLTMLRIGLIPVICVLLSLGDPLPCVVATALFGVASGTDFLDGYIARSRNLITLTGKFLDPLADKLIVMGMLVILVDLDRFPAWLVIVVLAREIGITALRSIASAEGMVIAAGKSGKYKTAFQLTGLVGLLIHFRYEVNFFFVTSPVNFHRVGLFLFGISVFFSLLSAYQYTAAFYRKMAEKG
jgi:CDP-diacylglycerol--glycerol-3-phosphate 3-phosphatidyltransferase